MKICDLHGLRFDEGKDKILCELNACLLQGETAIQIIHGYHGHAFKDYIQSVDFIADMEDEGIFLTLTARHSKDGVSEFRIESPEHSPINVTAVRPITLINRPSGHGKKKMTLEEAQVFFGNLPE